MTALALMTALAFAPAQPGSLKLTNVRTTYGELGGTRPEAKYLPGDAFFLGYDIEGITVSPSGQVQYRMTLEVTDAAGKQIFKQDPADKFDFMPLGGSKLPARAFILLGSDMAAGQYKMKLTVADNASRQTQTLEKSFEVLKPDFGVVRVYTSVDVAGDIPAATTGVVGQAPFVQFAIVGFERSKEEKNKDPKLGPQPDLTIQMTALDESGKPAVAEPTEYKQNGESAVRLEPNDPIIIARFLVPMTRTGKYTIRLKATDNVTKKTATFDLPIVVVPSPN